MAAAALVALSLTPGPARAQSMRTVPTPHWSYRIADRLLLRLPELSRHVWIASRPWRESEFRALVERARELRPSAGLLERSEDPRVQAWISMLEEEYVAGRGRAGERFPVDVLNAVTGAYEGSYRTDDATFEPAFEPTRVDRDEGAPENRIHATHDLALQYRDRLAVVWRYVVDQNVTNDPTRARLSPSFRDQGDEDEFGIVVLDAYVAVDAGPARLRLGRSTTSLGPGRGAGALVSDSIPPLDHVRLDVDFGNLRATGLVGRLSQDDQNRSLDAEGRVVPGSEPPGSARPVERRVYLHRLDWRWGSRLQAALTEGVVATGFDREIDPEFAALVVPFAALRDGSRESLLVSSEAVLTPWARTRLYGQLIVMDGESRDPDTVWRLGGTLADPGVAGIELGAEYTRVATPAFLDPGLNTGWTTFDVPVGTMLGPDADQAEVWVEAWPMPSLRLTADLMRRRSGEREIGTAGDPVGEAFPSGVPERQWRAGVEAWWLRPGSWFEASARVDHRTVENLFHEPGRDDTFWRAELGLTVRWQHRIR